MPKHNLLILGGTGEARRLAGALAGSRWQVITSLAGRTTNPPVLPGQVRTGGFGGMAGLKAYLVTEQIDAVIDATHPFAARISANALKSTREANCPLLRLERPEWQAGDGDNWLNVPSVEDAVRASPAGARLFLTLGRQEMALFACRTDIEFIARMIEAPDQPPGNGSVILARPPFTYDGERTLMKDYRVTHLVSRNSGGAQTAPKLQAARDLKLPVIMISRPAPLAGVDTVSTSEQAIDWLKHLEKTLS